MKNKKKRIFNNILVAATVLLLTSTPYANPAWDSAVVDPAAASLARPTAAQYAWHEQDRTMFVTFGVATWLGLEYDNTKMTFDIAKMNPKNFNAGKICRVAKSWGAKMLLLVCKHVGSFCWWPTTTTSYNVSNIPWKGGKGNLVKEVADSCRNNGLQIGVYIYSDDPRYTSGIGMGGKTDNPANQPLWDSLLRQQWKEVLTICGKDLIREVWFDGGCVVPLKDIIDSLAPAAVAFGPSLFSNPISWVGNENGIAPDPNWDAITGAGNYSPNGTIWYPAECDVTLYNHYWFWSQNNMRASKTLDQLMDVYLASTGHGSLMLLDSSPDTLGVIEPPDTALYSQFGAEITAEFGHPIVDVQQKAGFSSVIALGGVQTVNCADLWEEYEYGQRIHAFTVEAHVVGAWQQVAAGTSIGRRKINIFPAVPADSIRVTINQSTGTPLLRHIIMHHVSAAMETRYSTIPLVSRGATVTASSTYNSNYNPNFINDGKTETRWAAMDTNILAWVQFDFGQPHRFAHMAVSELAARIQGFVIEVRDTTSDPWRTIFTGTAVGASYSSDLPPTTVRYVRFRVTQNSSGLGPTIWEWSLTDRPTAWELVSTQTMPANGSVVNIDLSNQVVAAEKFEVRVIGALISGVHPVFEGLVDDRFLTKEDTVTFILSRTQSIMAGTSTGLRFTVAAPYTDSIKVLIRPFTIVYTPQQFSWKFDANSGASVLEDVKNISYPILGTVSWTTGKVNSALKFDGISTCINIGSSVPVQNNFTIAAWINPATTRFQEIVGKERCNQSAYQWRLYLNTQNRLGYEATDSISRDYGIFPFETGLAIPVNTWTHVAVTRNYNVYKLYINGGLAASKMVSGFIEQTSNPISMLIGARYQPDSMPVRYADYFAGSMDELKMFNGCLSDSQIGSLADGKNLVRYPAKIIMPAVPVILRFHNGSVLVTTAAASGEKSVISIFNAGGRLLKSIEFTGKTTTVYLGALRGVYIIEVKSGPSECHMVCPQVF